MGLDYLTLAVRRILSAKPRIRLATQIGSGLMGSCISDEPSIGLHQRDNGSSSKRCKARDLGNTLIVVEHDEETMYAATI